MADRSIEDIRQTFRRAKDDAAGDDALKTRLRNSFSETLAAHPYRLTASEVQLAHEDSLRLDPECPYYCLAGLIRSNRPSE